MTRSEEWASGASEAHARADAFATENAALHAAVKAQSATLERLIALNAELADGANVAAASREAGVVASAPASAAQQAPLSPPLSPDSSWSLPLEPSQPQPPRRGLLARAWGLAAYVAGSEGAEERRAAAAGRTPMPV